MPNDIMIRNLARGDVECLVEIALAAWAPIYAEYRRMMGDEMFQFLIPDWAEQKAGQIRRACEPGSEATVYVAERAGRVVGFVTFYSDPATGVGTIGNNAVHPDFQRKGIGPRMYEHAIARLKALGMKVVKVTTGGDPAHAPARRAYEKVGFSIAIPHVEYYRKL